MSCKKLNAFGKNSTKKLKDINTSSLGLYYKFEEYDEDNKYYLIKTGRFIGNKFSSLEPVTECICYEFGKLLGIDVAEYTLDIKDVVYNNKEYKNTTVCRSKWFLAQNEEFSSIRSLYVNSNKTEVYNEITERFPGERINIDNMIVFDYLINNTDRHFRNFGIINNDKLAPLYDHGLSLGSDLDDIIFYEEDIQDILMDCDYSKCFCTSNLKQLALIDNHSLDLASFELNYKDVINKYDCYLKSYRKDFILKLIEERLKYVKEL